MGKNKDKNKDIEMSVDTFDRQQEETKQKLNVTREVKFLTKEWAIQEGLDPLLFKKWENQLMTEEEFKKLKMERGV